MIYDSISNIDLYKGIHKNLDTTIDYIKKCDFTKLKAGKIEICEDEIYANVVKGHLINVNEGQYEVHHCYLDIHIDILGSEKICYTDYIKEKEIEKYNKKEDFALLMGEMVAECVIDQDHFAICMVGEPHMPCVKNELDQNEVYKIIFKVKVK